MKKFNNINFVLATITLIITLISLFFLPNSVPIHTHFDGVDGWGSKYTNIIVPVIAYILWFMMPKIMSQKNNQAKMLGRQIGEIYLIKNRIIINMIFLSFVGFDLYVIYQDFLYTSKKVSLNFFLLIAVAVLYITASFMIFYMEDEELISLHWKEFTPTDSKSSIKKTKILFLLSGCIVAMLIIGDAFFYKKSIVLATISLILLLLKFLVGLRKA